MAKTNFIDGDKSQGILGTRILAAFLNEIFNHRHTGINNDGHAPIDYAIGTGDANGYTVTLTPALIANIVGMPIRFKVVNANTGASTLNINGLGATAIKKNINQALAAGDIQAGQIVEVVYDGTNFQLINNGQSVDSSQFASSLVAIGGYKKYPDKNSPSGYFIEQWGQATISAGANTFQTVTLPVTFPSAILGAYGSSTSAASYAGANMVSTSQIQIFGSNNGAGVFWRALGY